MTSRLLSSGPRRHRVEVRPHQAVDELLRRGRHAAAALQHRAQPQVRPLPAGVAAPQAEEAGPARRGRPQV